MSMSSDLEFPSLLQQYIYPKSSKASIIRICVKTKNCSDKMATFGFKISNKFKINGEKNCKNEKKLATINKAFKDSFMVTNLSYGVLCEAKSEADKLVFFLEKVFQTRLTEIVLDFIRDRKGRMIFFNVKRILFSSKKNKNYTIRDINELSCSVYCKLCGLFFHKDDAKKVLTYKLLWEFCKHAS